MEAHTHGPEPLDPGTILSDRYEVLSVLGQGGFGITYEVRPTHGGPLRVIKELAPQGVVREANGFLNFDAFGPAARQRLRAQFESEGRRLQRIRIPGIVRGHETFHENGTAYLVMERVEGAVSLARLAQSEGRLEVRAVLELLDHILDILEPLHAQGLLHRDLKPSNILVDPEGRPWLIDFGSAREWVADLTVRHTALYTPGFAPLEQLSENARRGPGTDLFGLCATAFFLLTGRVPPAPGAEPIPLRSLRPDVPPHVADALQVGMALTLEKRPADARALRQLLFGPAGTPDPVPWQVLDAQLAQAWKLRPGKMECPACGDVLNEPRPKKPGTCLVCREGKVVLRDLSTDLCPCCKVGTLRHVVNSGPLAFSPLAPHRRLRSASRGLPWKPKAYVCEATEERFQEADGLIVRESTGEKRSWEEWRQLSGRGTSIWECEACAAQFDEQLDGRWLQVLPEPAVGMERFYPEEWARLARGLDPASGNAACDRCNAEYFAEEEAITLLGAIRDPYGVVDALQGRLIHAERAPWIAAGKTSGFPGVTCVGCGLELDRIEVPQEGVRWRLVLPVHDRMRQAVNDLETLPDWHRRYRQLPTVADEPMTEQLLEEALRLAYAEGSLDVQPGWKSNATWDGKSAPLVLTERGLEWGGLFKKTRWNFAELRHASALGPQRIALRTAEHEDVLAVEPMTVALRLESGKRTLSLTAFDLAERLQRQMATPAQSR